MIIEIDPLEIEFKKENQRWCLLKYLKHPKGCPNYGKKRNLNGIRSDLKSRVIRECPPTALLIDNIFDFSKPLFLIYNIYNVGKDAEERRINNPKLTTPGGWYNFRYWQNRARAELDNKVVDFLDGYPNTIVDLCPKAHGVNLSNLMRKKGKKLKWSDWPPKHSLNNKEYQIAFGGYPLNKK